MKKSITAINKCDFSLVELSEKGAGIGIELGYSSAHEIPIFTIWKQVTIFLRD